MEKRQGFHGLRRRMHRVIASGLKGMRFYSEPLANENGVFLVVLIVIIGIISVTSMATLGMLKREIHKTNNDYFDLVARCTAESGLELAKKDIFATGKVGYPPSSFPKKLEFKYGGEHFPENAGRVVNCRVIVYVHPENLYLESNAKVRNKTIDKGHSHIVAERTFKQLLRSIGSPPKFSTVWQVCD